MRFPFHPLTLPERALTDVSQDPFQQPRSYRTPFIERRGA